MLLEELLALRSELATLRSGNETAILETTTEGSMEPSAALPLQQTASSGNDSLLVTMGNMSLGSLSIPECRPSDGETDIDKKAWMHWKDILFASFNLSHTTDEHAKMDLFKIKAGTKLLEVMQGTSSSENMPDEDTMPFSNAVARLDQYYGSRTYIIGQRGKLMSLIQHNGESNISFVRRVAGAAKLCDYEREEEMEAVVRTIIKGTTDSRVRVLARRNWINQGDMNSLIALVRDREMEILDEEEFQKTNRQRSTTIAAVTRSTDESHQYRRGTGFKSRGVQRGRGSTRRGYAHHQAPTNACWRCGSIYHDPARCPNSDKVCHNCKRRGHLARSCLSAPQLEPAQKRRHDESDGEPRAKIAAITQNGEGIECKVLENDDIE